MNPNQEVDNIIHYEEEFEDEPILPPEFFTEMLSLEQTFARQPDQPTMASLLCYYTDCVNYFAEKEEPICEYFQLKIKDLIGQMKPSIGVSVPKESDRKRDQLTRNVMKEMQQKNIHSQITEEMKKQESIEDKVNKILLAQNEKLQRRRKSKRSMNKSQSMTYSFGSINSSPDLGMREEGTKRYHGLNAKYLFRRDINSSDQEQQTTT